MNTITKQALKNIKQITKFNGRKIIIKDFKPMSLNSFWAEGSRDFFWFVNTENFVSLPIAQNGTPFDHRNTSADRLPPGQVLVEMSIFQGKKSSLTIYV